MKGNQVEFQVKDHSFSGEVFSLVPMEGGALLKTVPQPADIARYYQSEDYISHTDGARNFFEKVYQKVKSVALAGKVSLINKHHTHGSLLDIGCGTGDFLLAAQNAGWHVTGCEPGDSARKLVLKKNLEVTDITSNLPSSSFDVITMWHVLEHVPDPDTQIREILRLLNPDGLVVIAVPNFNSRDAKHYGEYWAAYDVPRHLWHFSKTAVNNLADRNGMTVFDVRPMWFDAFYVSLLSERYKTGKMNFIAGIWQGLQSNLSALGTGECSSQIYLLRRR